MGWPRHGAYLAQGLAEGSDPLLPHLLVGGLVVLPLLLHPRARLEVKVMARPNLPGKTQKTVSRGSQPSRQEY